MKLLIKSDKNGKCLVYINDKGYMKKHIELKSCKEYMLFLECDTCNCYQSISQLSHSEQTGFEFEINESYIDFY